jgi:Tol biopolymer transport system component
LTEAPRPAHAWLVTADGKMAARRLTSGSWTLPVSLPPSAPSSPLSWSPDGKRLAIVKVATPYTGDSDRSAIQLLDVDSGEMHALSTRTHHESQPLFSPDGTHIAHWYPRDGETKNVNEIYVGPASGGETASVTPTEKIFWSAPTTAPPPASGFSPSTAERERSTWAR